MTETTLSHYEGVFPPSEVVEIYEKFQPGSANRMLTMIENQVNGRLESEKNLVAITTYTAKSEVIYNMIGLISSFIIILMILIFGFILAFYKNQYGLLASGVITALLASMVKIFYKK